ncbi:OmpA family protein [Campylobacter sp. MG1]|uniref:OmpA family protein n=1 Tax=Campylobacter sp. MG1 TaxID=2976332 RepID=UPI00226CABFB|nr:OmpA family protein [Campylobacter sp. MG1]
MKTKIKLCFLSTLLVGLSACSQNYGSYNFTQNDVARQLLVDPKIIEKPIQNSNNNSLNSNYQQNNYTVPNTYDAPNNTPNNAKLRQQQGQNQQDDGLDDNDMQNDNFTQKSYSTQSKFQKTLFLLDASGSMDLIDYGNNNNTRIDSAKEVIRDIISNLSADKTSASLIKFGNSCQTSVVNDFTTDKNKLINSLNSIRASGSTPLAKAILEASNIVANDDTNINVILLSDGEETCNGNPLEAVKTFVRDNPNSTISIYIVGYSVDESTKRQLEQLVVGNGKYYDVKNQSELIKALEKITNELNISNNYQYSIQFDNNSIVIKPEFKDSIEDFADYVISNDLKAIIRGHADSVGSSAINKQISKQRAYEVKKELIKLGVDNNNIKVESYSDTKPIDTNNTEDGRYRNRRVELIAQ